MKKYRFFYHYYKKDNKMSIHFKKTCTIVDNVICKVECETKWNSYQQPKLVMQGWASEVIFENNVAIIK